MADERTNLQAIADASGTKADAPASGTQTTADGTVVGLLKGAVNYLYLIYQDVHKLVTPAKTPVTGTFTAQNQYSAALVVDAEHYAVVNLSGISGDVVTLQQSYNSGTWEDVDTFTADISGHLVMIGESNIRLRLGVKTGHYGAGTIAYRLSQG
jgi:hypothetical protein